MILADASLVIEFQRGRDAKLARLVPALPVVVCGVTVSEVLGGSRTATEYADADAALNRFAHLATPEPVWRLQADHRMALRRAGLVVPFPDVLVASVAIHHNVELWSRDHHHRQMQAALPALRLFAEPP